MKTYFVAMNYSNCRQDKYIKCKADYDAPERAGIDPDEYFRFNTIEEAERIKNEVETYARKNGDDYTKFYIETWDF